ncbi:protein piccolo [Echinococcus multilocularis]|uniref:Protein piccolo n=1 Tax=Echinococcus multilocularis TaxID=6211 RepID=A0A0S4MJH8_ECHMU|nr:protein piccolo [Echinococcus multilocularis]
MEEKYGRIVMTPRCLTRTLPALSIPGLNYALISSLTLPHVTSPRLASPHLITLFASRLMGNETSYQEHRYPVLAFEAPSRHSQTAASLPESLTFCAQQENFTRRRKSLPSEPDYTDSSDNSVISGRHQFPRSTNINNPIASSSWLRTAPATCGTPSSERGSIFDVLVKRISGSGQNQTSSSDEDQTGGTRDLSSTTSLQDSACEFLESSQQLTEEEKAQIKDVLDRVKQVENREAKRISDSAIIST